MGCTIPAPPKKFNAAINANDLFVFIIIRAFVWQGQPLTPAYWVIPKLDLLSKICSALLILVLVAAAGFLPDFAMRDSRYTTTAIFKERFNPLPILFQSVQSCRWSCVTHWIGDLFKCFPSFCNGLSNNRAKR